MRRIRDPRLVALNNIIDEQLKLIFAFIRESPEVVEKIEPLPLREAVRKYLDASIKEVKLELEIARQGERRRQCNAK